jgi:hypothetical protein
VMAEVCVIKAQAGLAVHPITHPVPIAQREFTHLEVIILPESSLTTGGAHREHHRHSVHVERLLEFGEDTG